jgi:peroxiredoxin Q/BCP
MERPPQVGDQAPDFEIEGTDGPFRLSEHRGKVVALLFYPGDNYLVCTRQFCSYRDRVDMFRELDLDPVGISSQTLASHKDFIARHGLTVPLLADTKHEAAALYTVHSKRFGTRRAAFLIDEGGVVRYRHDNPLSLSYDSVDDLRHALIELRGR